MNIAPKRPHFHRYWQLYAMMVIPLIYFILFKYVPMFGNVLAFRRYRPGMGPFGTEWVGLQYFKRFAQDPAFWRAFRNTLTLSLMNLMVNFPIPIIFAILVNELRNLRFKKIVQTVSYMPRFISTVVVIAILGELLSPSSGIINLFLKRFFDIDPIYFMNDEKYFRWIYVFVDTWQYTGWTAIIYLAAITGISSDLYEAATIDGATRLQQVFYITIPSIMPTIMVMLILVAMVMLLIEDLKYQADFPLVATAAFISFGFAFFAYRLKTADIPGLFSAALVGILLIVFAGISWFLIMLSFFIIGAASTRYQMEYKKSLHVEQESGGVRGYINVFANGLVSVSAAVCFGVTQHPAFIAVYLGSIATAAADTVAGEIGVCSGRPYLITTLKPVPEGTNGGVSITGEMAGLCAAIFVSACAVLLGVADLSVFIAGVIGGLIGANIDSLIGEVLENKKIIGNAGTNFLATLGGGVVTLLIWIELNTFF